MRSFPRPHRRFSLRCPVSSPPRASRREARSRVDGRRPVRAPLDRGARDPGGSKAERARRGARGSPDQGPAKALHDDGPRDGRRRSRHRTLGRSARARHRRRTGYRAGDGWHRRHVKLPRWCRRYRSHFDGRDSLRCDDRRQGDGEANAGCQDFRCAAPAQQ